MNNQSLVSVVFAQSFECVEWIKHVARTNGKTIRGSNCSTENYICVDGTNYYLSENDWCSIYERIMELNRKDFEENTASLVFSKKPYSLQLSEGKTKIIEAMKDYIAEPIMVSAPNESAPAKWEKAMKQMVQKEPQALAIVIFYTLQDEVLDAITKGRLTPENSFKITEPRLSTILAKGLIYYFFQLKPGITRLLGNNKEISMDKNIKLQEAFSSAIEVYHKNQNDLTRIFQQDENIKLFRELCPEYADNINILEIFVLQLLLYGIRKIRREDSLYIQIKLVIIEQVTIQFWEDIEVQIMDRLWNQYVIAGLSMVAHLNQKRIFRATNEKKEGDPNYKKTRMHELDSKISLDMQVSSTNFCPYLIRLNRGQLSKVFLETAYVSYKADRLTQNVHNKFLNQGILLDNSIFVTNPEVMVTRFSVDRQFLEEFLAFFDKIVNQRIQYLSDKDKNNVYLFGSLYNLNFRELYEKPASGTYRDIVEELINFGLSVEKDAVLPFENIYAGLEKKIKNIREPQVRAKFNTIYHTILGYKRALIGTLSQAIIYSHFDNLLIPSYFDFRGRKYYVGAHLNPQSYPFIKAFLKPHETIPKEVDNYVLHKAVLNVINNDHVKKELMGNPGVGNPEGVQEQIMLYFYSFFDPKKISLENFKDCLRRTTQLGGADFASWFSFICTHIKDHRKALMITSYILLENRSQLDGFQPRFANAYSYDGVNSGYQMMSILFKNREVGKHCNLVGTETRDLYQAFTNDFEKDFTVFDKILKLILKDIYGKDGDWSGFLADIEKNAARCFRRSFVSDHPPLIDITATPVKDLIIYLFTQQPTLDNVNYIKLSAIVDKIMNDERWNKYFAEKYNLYSSSLVWLLRRGVVYTYYLQKKVEPIWGLFCFYEVIRMRYVLSKNNWILETRPPLLFSRELFKKSIMIEIYGGTFISRQASMLAFFHLKNMELGLDFVDENALKILCCYLDAFFRCYLSGKLQVTALLGKLAKIVASHERPITIKNKDFSIFQTFPKYNGNKIQRVMVRTITEKERPYRLSLMQLFMKESTVQYDKQQGISHFPPNFIHSMDATIVHQYVKLCYQLQKNLEPYDVSFNQVTNHDNFCIGRRLFPFLPYILRDCYMDLYQYGYLETIKDNLNPKEYTYIQTFCQQPGDPNYLSGTFENPNFIKFG